MNFVRYLTLTGLAVTSYALIACEAAIGAQCDEESALEQGLVDATRGPKKIKCLKVRDLQVCGNEIINGNITIDGNATLSQLSVLGAAAIGGNLNVTGTVIAGDYALSPAPAAGTPGIPGLGGDLAYGYVASDAANSIGNAALVPFAINQILSGITIASNTTMTVTNAGIYKIQFLVRGINAGTNTNPLIFSIYNVTSSTALATFESTNPVTAGQTATVGGTFVTILSAGQEIAIVNGSAADVALANDGNVNGFFLVERIAV